MYSNLGIELENVLKIPSEMYQVFSEGDELSLMKMGLGLASSPRFI